MPMYSVMAAVGSSKISSTCSTNSWTSSSSMNSEIPIASMRASRASQAITSEMFCTGICYINSSISWITSCVDECWFDNFKHLGNIDWHLVGFIQIKVVRVGHEFFQIQDLGWLVSNVHCELVCGLISPCNWIKGVSKRVESVVVHCQWLSFLTNSDGKHHQNYGT